MAKQSTVMIQLLAAIYLCSGCAPKLFTGVEVSFATDRKLNFITSSTPEGKSAIGPSFGSERETASYRMNYGTCLVTIPKTHKIGELEEPSIVKRELYKRLNLQMNDPAQYVQISKITLDEGPHFFSRLSEDINKLAGKSAFIFIHGYNVTFENAAKRTAQIYYDLKFTGMPIFYSWPSKGKILDYPDDETNIKWTQLHLEEFLKNFFRKTNADNVYIIAHSMGNRAMTEAINSVADSIPGVRDRLKEVILAAPDIDADTFKESIAPKLKKACKRVTVYGSSSDMAILLSKQFHSFKRLGDSFNEAVIEPGIEYIDATGVDTSFLGHSYIATSRTIMADIADIINNKLGATQRFGLEKVEVKPVPYWKFRE